MTPKSVRHPQNPFDRPFNMAGNWLDANFLPSLVRNNGIVVIQVGYGDSGSGLGSGGIGPQMAPISTLSDHALQ
jgi:hypothetical protein